MKTNFDINIPSIPTNIIKFKIQDIKNTAFGSQKNRFNENKAFLTKKFIESFNNFKQKQTKQLIDTTQTQADSQISFKPQKAQSQYRFLIPEEKKYMLHHYQKYKNYQAPMSKETKYNRGYSFYKTDNISLNKNRQQKSFANSIDDNHLTDNFYFPTKKQKSNMEMQERKNVQPSCIFKNQTRKRVYSKMQKTANAIPGPGTYLFPLQKIQKRSKPREVQDDSEFDYKNLRKIITNIIVNDDIPLQKKQEVVQPEEKKMNYMFIEDDRDRFGNQKYPIAARVNVPGPGAYEINDSLEGNAKKVILVEEQRKLLKEWFNN